MSQARNTLPVRGFGFRPLRFVAFAADLLDVDGGGSTSDSAPSDSIHLLTDSAALSGYSSSTSEADQNHQDSTRLRPTTSSNDQLDIDIISVSRIHYHFWKSRPDFWPSSASFVSYLLMKILPRTLHSLTRSFSSLSLHGFRDRVPQLLKQSTSGKERDMPLQLQRDSTVAKQ